MLVTSDNETLRGGLLPEENNPERRSASRRRIFAVLAVFFGLLLGFSFAELGVRLFGVEPPKMMTKRQLIDLDHDQPLYYHCYPDNPHGEFQPVPDASQGQWQLHEYTFEKTRLPLERLRETPWCVEYLHSSKGIRDREFAELTPPGKTRIALVGDSFVFGEGVPVHKTLPRQLQEKLGDRIECINAGQVGANAEQEFAILNSILLDADCRRIVLVIIPNDIPLTPSLAKEQDYINDFILIRDRYLEQAWDKSLWLGHSRVVDLVTAPRAMAKIRQETIAWYLRCYSAERNRRNLAWMRQQFQDVGARKDCHVAVVLYPLLESLDEDYPLVEVHEVIRQMVERAGLPFLDLTPVFAGQKTSELWVHETDHHPNGQAHQLAATAIYEWLQMSDPLDLSDGPVLETAQ